MPDTPRELPENLTAEQKAAEKEKIIDSLRIRMKKLLADVKKERGEDVPSSETETKTGDTANGTVEGKDVKTIPGGKWGGNLTGFENPESVANYFDTRTNQ